MRRFITLSLSHGAALMVGFVLGIYLLPILTAPKAPDTIVLEQMAEGAEFTGTFTRDLRGSDFLHWGEGAVSITDNQIIHKGKLSPGPDYKLYLVKDFVEHENEFISIKSSAQYVGDVKSFNGFALDLPQDVDPSEYTTVVIWCEAFSEFITAAPYQSI
ncbi:MAG: DM13 domain-containing protein [Pseudomonadota bacterium]